MEQKQKNKRGLSSRTNRRTLGGRNGQVDGGGSSDESHSQNWIFCGVTDLQKIDVGVLERSAGWLRSAWKNVSVEQQEPVNKQQP